MFMLALVVRRAEAMVTPRRLGYEMCTQFGCPAGYENTGAEIPGGGCDPPYSEYCYVNSIDCPSGQAVLRVDYCWTNYGRQMSTCCRRPFPSPPPPSAPPPPSPPPPSPSPPPPPPPPPSPPSPPPRPPPPPAQSPDDQGDNAVMSEGVMIALITAGSTICVSLLGIAAKCYQTKKAAKDRVLPN